jgi:hypothetical protein
VLHVEDPDQNGCHRDPDHESCSNVRFGGVKRRWGFPFDTGACSNDISYAVAILRRMGEVARLIGVSDREWRHVLLIGTNRTLELNPGVKTTVPGEGNKPARQVMLLFQLSVYSRTAAWCPSFQRRESRLSTNFRAISVFKFRMLNPRWISTL